MALIGNGSNLHKSPGRFLSGPTLSIDRGNFNKSGMNRNKYLSLDKKNAVPSGYSPGYSYVIAQNSGGLASYKELESSISNTALLVSGINVSADLDGAISITQAQLDQIIALVASISASISTTDAQLAAVANLIASISASMSVTDAQLGAIVGLIASMTASISVSANNFATAELEADISSQTELSPGALAASLWNAVASDYNTSGTMGEKLNDAGSASNPWTEVIESGYTAEEVLRILLAVAAGKTDINGTTVTFRNVADDANRVTATMTGSERTSITLNGA
jgi:hypothetical protein